MDGHIPELMLFEVLVRLPVKVLFKFKIVSKQWHSMISDPSFARMYVARTSLLPHSQQWILISCCARKPIIEQFFRKKLPLRRCSLGMNYLDLLRLQEITEVYGRVLVGISNGLSLYGDPYYVGDCSRDRICSYEICNPITGQRITLPPYEHCFEFAFTGFMTQIKDNILESYRVLRIDAKFIKNRSFVTFEVYFSETHEWVYYAADFDQTIYFDKWENPIVIDKIMHWIIVGHIMAFDLYNKPDSVRLISLPIDSVGSQIDMEYILLDEHHGHLRYIELVHGQGNKLSLSLWVLNDYDLGEWCMQHSVILDNFWHNDVLDIFPLPLSFHPFDSNIVFMVHREGFLSYDIKTRELKAVEETTYDSSIDNLCRLSCFTRYFLFVIPQWPVRLNFEVIED